MINLASFQSHLRLWPHLSRWWSTEKQASQPLPALADQAAIQRHSLALHRAYKRFALRYPQWVQHRFDEEFLRQMTSGPVLPTGPELAVAWDRCFGPLATPAVRCQQMAELVNVANHFLLFYQESRQ